MFVPSRSGGRRRERRWRAAGTAGALFIEAVLVAGAAGATQAEAPPQPEAVVLLHGLGRTDRSMRPLELRLAEAGFRVQNLSYASTEHEPEVLVQEIARQVEACCGSAPRLHFVTHSLGGILLRAWLADERPPNLGRVVMLAPPNHGTPIVDALGGSVLFEWLFGPTAQELGTQEGSLPERLPPPTYEVGVIAGSSAAHPMGVLLVPGDDDGTVSVESTRLPGMADWLLVPHSHTFLMRSESVANQVVYFLHQGAFQHEAPPDAP